MAADVELLPCPFCGGTNVGEDWVTTYSVDSSYAVFGCRDCGARYEDGGPNEWNRRSTAAQAAEIEALRAEVDEWKRVAAAQAELHDEAEARADKLEEALRGWWEARRPVSWTEDQHRSCPHVNLATDAEKALATALLRELEEGK